ncbi:MAG: hypothetical protein ABIG44_07425 [Planctomycetota bacterium]
MLNRWIGITCLTFMLSANALLFIRDILPTWLTGDPPLLVADSPAIGLKQQAQLGIFDDEGRVVGRNWTISETQGLFLEVNSCTLLRPVMLPNGIATPEVRIDTRLRYRQEDGMLSELVLTLRGLPTSIRLRGEFMPPDEFACSWKVGYQPGGTFVLPAEATRALGDVFRPFARLPGLYVGRTWRLNILDPLAHILPGLKDQSMLAEPIIVRVTGKEQIQQAGQMIEAYIVEAPRTKAWVASDGNVLRQELELPILGKLILRAESFDGEAYKNAKQWPPYLNQQEDEE